MKPRATHVVSLVFIGIVLLGTVLAFFTERSRIIHRQAQALVAASHYAERIIVHVDRALSATYALAAMVKVNHGEVTDFDVVAGEMLRFYPDVGSLQLAPKGIVTHVVPMAGNEKAIGHDLLRDEKRNKEAILARNTGRLTLAGPFELIQGGSVAVIGRLPIFLREASGQERFWGFSTVLIRVPRLLEGVRMSGLHEEGYHYQLWRVHPDTGERQVFAASPEAELRSPVVHEFDVPNGKWNLSVERRGGWVSYGWIAFEALFTLCAASLFAWLAFHVLYDQIFPEA